jgi:hypothetical protein
MAAPFFSARSQKRPAMAAELPLGLGLANKHTIFIHFSPYRVNSTIQAAGSAENNASGDSGERNTINATRKSFIRYRNGP